MINGILGFKLLPCYSLLQEEKQSCHPKYKVSDEGDVAQCELEAVLEHTVQRTFQIPEVAAKIAAIKEENKVDGLIDVDMEYKVSMDGLGGLQKLQQGGKLINKDSHCVATSMSPLQYSTSLEDQTAKKVIHTNYFANSACGQRPLKLAMAKEEKGT